MKSLAYKIAVASSVVAFIMTLLLVVHVQDVSLVATVLEQGDSSVQLRDSKRLPEKIKISYDFGKVDVSSIKNVSFFPEIEDRVQPLTTGNTPLCPFTAEAGSVVIDFTNNGSVSLEELYLYANKDIEEGKNVVTYGVDVGTYVVELASYNSEDIEENNYEQQWYLEFRDAEGIVYTTQPTRDMYVGESEMIELVERDMVLTTPVSQVRAVHTAFPDTEPQTIAPLCARLSKQITQVEEKNDLVRLQGDEKKLFSATVFLQHSNNQPESHFFFTLGVMLMLLCAMGVFIGSTISRRN
ncbi:MAG: hypothetical protein UV60_C0009G0006 [Parcubacteria group bacterium GW2011_GWA2_43_11]|nr:MAG: hypothetical protein UU89_C0039G0002 [Parcubacteria group bacterium GW2011_GWC2_42_11]KKS85285.1 MAG: hypothetical protein UV60_C0009G0006 [Parcubacteria group bacterium GW2011_GWA2_43_11]